MAHAPTTKRPKLPSVELVMLQGVLFGSQCKKHKFTKRPGWQTCTHCPVKGFYRRVQP